MGMKCIVCSSVEGWQKMIVPKNDDLAKHQGKHVCTVDGVSSGMKVGDVYSATNCAHMKVCRTWAGKKLALVVEQVVSSLAKEYKQKGVQFATFFELLSYRCPMVDYERSKVLFKHLKVKNMPSRHWSESTGWEMSEHLHLLVLSHLKSVV